MTTVQTIAAWMLAEIKRHGTLEHYQVAAEIVERFGPEWDYANENGNPAVDPRILRQFRRQHAGTVEWDKSGLCWALTEHN